MRCRFLIFLLMCVVTTAACADASGPFFILSPQSLHAEMGSDEDWIITNAPLFDCSDPVLREIYYFRWHVYHRHIVRTPDGYVVTEFLPNVSWAGKDNTISCAAGHHFYEGRWLRDRTYLDDYATFWFRRGGEPRRYSFWAADAMWARYLVTGDRAFVTGLLPDLVKNYQAWEKGHRDPNGLFWQIDDRDGMEYSIGGSGYRPTINAYMYGDAVAIAKIARLAGQPTVADQFQATAAAIKRLVQERLWNANDQFFETVPRNAGGDSRPVGVREEVGFVPWYFNLPDPGYEAAWAQAIDPQGFLGWFGFTTAERRSPRFNFAAKHDCLWNGPSWPYATTQTLVAMANLLNNYSQHVITTADYFDCLKRYGISQHKDGKPWIAEDLDADTGRWIVDLPRSVDYNHSGFCDLILTGLVGLRPRADERIEVNPLVPEGGLNWFAADGIPYHERSVSIAYDRNGAHFHRGAGLRVWVDGTEVAASPKIGRLSAELPKAAAAASPAPATPATPATRPAADAGWEKYPGNPVLGGRLGTCFDVAVLHDSDRYRMYFSWRPKKSVALVESVDGIHWSEPTIVLGPNPKTDWEADINRPVVVKRRDGYRMWYTGQARGHSWIGYATSPDGKTWTRQSDQAVLSPDQAWEKVAVMCPDVMWDESAKQYRMWYSGGEQYEPDAIGYATSADGLTWTKRGDNPIFKSDPAHAWEQHKVTACQVVKHGDQYLMFYIGFRDVNHAQIGLARSADGITGWERLPANPIIRPDPNQWDHDACYKPFAIYDAPTSRWLLWYNGRHGAVEQIGLATHVGEDLGFGSHRLEKAPAPPTIAPR